MKNFLLIGLLMTLSSPLFAQKAASVEPGFETGEQTGCTSCADCRDTEMKNYFLFQCAPKTSAVVRLINKETGQCCRIVYVNEGDSLRIDQIPAGKYIARIAYGHDWEVTNSRTCAGQFTRSALYKESKRNFDFTPKEKKRFIEFPSYQLTLSLTETEAPDNAGKAIKDKVISADEFNK